MAKKIKKVLGTNRNVVPGIGPLNNLYVKAGDFNPLVDEFNQAVDDTYTFDGAKTFSDDVTFNTDVDIVGDLTVTGDITGTFVITGPTTFDDTITVEPVSNQIILGGSGATKTVTITAPTPAADAIVTIPDVGATGTVAMLEGTQTITGSKTFDAAVNISPVTNQIVFGGAGGALKTTLSAATPAAVSINTIPDVGVTGTFAMLEGAQIFSGAKTFGDRIAIGNSVQKTTTGVSQTFPAANSVVLVTTTTNADAAKIPNAGLIDGQIYTVIIEAVGAPTDQLVLTPVNPGEFFGYTAITQSAGATGASVTLRWVGGTVNKWAVLSTVGFTAV